MEDPNSKQSQSHQVTWTVFPLASAFSEGSRIRRLPGGGGVEGPQEQVGSGLQLAGERLMGCGLWERGCR